MSDVSEGPGWWQASDGKWYPPQQHPAAPQHEQAAPAQAPAGEPATASTGRRRLTGPLIGALVLAIIIGAGAAVIITQGDDDDDIGNDQASGEIVLELASDTGLDPFYEDLAAEATDELDAFIDEGSPDLADQDTGEVDGDEPGLYGGTRDEASCDAEQLAEFLAEADDKAEAWSDVLGLEAERIDEYLDTLTPVNLTVDTLVVNHGFADGVATPRETVLQRGSAVLVDVRGVPRVRCSCGNPLLEPTSTNVADHDFSGVRWPAFDPGLVVVVTVAVTDVTTFELVDVATGDTFARPVGTNGDADQTTGEDDVEDPADRAGVDSRPLVECGEVMRHSGVPVTVSTRAPEGIDVCPQAMAIVEQSIDQWMAGGRIDGQFGDWHCATATGMGLEPGQIFGCHWPAGDAHIVVTEGGSTGADPDNGFGGPADPEYGLGGPGESVACGATEVNGRKLEVDATGVSCDVAIAVVKRTEDRQADSFDGEEAIWEFDDGWFCRFYGAGLFAECGSDIGYIEVRPHVDELG